jgi:hypothetical protein
VRFGAKNLKNEQEIEWEVKKIAPSTPDPNFEPTVTKSIKSLGGV